MLKGKGKRWRGRGAWFSNFAYDFPLLFFLLFEGEEVKCQRYIVLQLKEYVCGKNSFLAKALVEGSIYSSLFSKNVFVSKSKECRSKLRE